MIMFCIMCGAAGGPRWEPESPRRSISTTQKIRSIGREARVNQLISERLEHWKARMRERGEHTCTHMHSASMNPGWQQYPVDAHWRRRHADAPVMVCTAPSANQSQAAQGRENTSNNVLEDMTEVKLETG